MLAQNFKTADDLGLTDLQLSALQKVLVLLETGKLQHRDVSEEADGSEEPTFCSNFNMRFWQSEHPCGTVACIGGTAELIAGVKFDRWMQNPALFSLFWPPLEGNLDIAAVTTDEAATALRSYLTTGDARWDLAVA